MFALAMIFYNIAFPILFVIYFPFYKRKLEKRGGYKEGFGERFGKFDEEKLKHLHALKDPVWIHAVSVGETVVALRFIEKWLETDPTLNIILSTTTSTGQKIARDKAPDSVTIIYAPIDLVTCVKRTLNALRPKSLIIFEVEIWPNLIRQCQKRGIELSLINCRMSDKSAAGFKKHAWFFKHLFKAFKLIAVQGNDDAKRVTSVIGKSDKIFISGTMKFDQIPDVKAAEFTETSLIFPDDALIFTAASIHPGEPEIMLDCFLKLREKQPKLRLILVPRHVEKKDQFIKCLEDRQVNYTSLTDLRSSNESVEKDVLLVDTTGEMMSILALSDIVFVGKSLGGNEGGHNVIEPAVFGKAIICGSQMQNFRLVVSLFTEAKAILQVADAKAFEHALDALIEDDAKRIALGEAARELVEQKRGAIDATIAKLINY